MIDDPVYGQQPVDEPVLQELIASDPVQRLQHVHQAGPQPFFMDVEPLTRYGHSVGVMLLLRAHGASLPEQVAGLLHDVPHTAFSHLADFVFPNDDHEFHERFMEQVVRDSDIPAILDRHGLDLDHILDEDNFPLLERDAPDLCADRIDYFLRDIHLKDGADVQRFINALTTHDDRFVLDDRDVAEGFAIAYIDADETHWANPREIAVTRLFADAVRRALDIGVLERDDLFGTDEDVLETITDSDDAFIRERLAVLRDGAFTVGADDPDFVVETKCRWVDPYVLDGSGLVRVTDYSDRLRERIEAHRDFVAGGYAVGIDR